MYRILKILNISVICIMALFFTANAYSGSRSFKLVPLEKEPKNGRKILSDEELTELKNSVAKDPKDRGKRLNMIRSLMISGKMRDALNEALEWRKIDAYNLVVIRLLGDIYAEMNDNIKAKRAYSAVIELLPKSTQANRALATVLKQAGDLSTAYERLLYASRVSPNEKRLMFELADTAQRTGKIKEASDIFSSIIESKDVSDEISYPAKQRLAQILTSMKREALKKNDNETADKLAERIENLKVKGGAVNDLKIYLSWDTNGSDVDLWVTNPVGQKIYYKKKRGRYGGELYHDVTSGYGPESFTATKTVKGTYLVQVNYYGTNNRSSFKEARGEVVVVLNEGTAEETKHVLPYRLFNKGQVVSVCKIIISDQEN